jgi:hypothetical protein
MVVASLGRSAKRLKGPLAYVLFIATFSGFLAYAATISISAIARRNVGDPRANAQHAFYLVGFLGLVVVLFMSAGRH